VSKTHRCENCGRILCKAEDELLDRAQAAKYLGGLSPGTLAVWDCTKRYNLKPVKIGTAVRYRKSVLDQFLEDQTKP